jgi:DNA mismatch repair protein MutL
MARIHVLSGPVADQIAAGEVVERPASVVKELVENAIDAGATTIDITIEDGGRQLIRIADDGCGMDAEDAPRALERHATSKIVSAEDLVGVASFGFRGEALPAIASVSEFALETSATDGDGTRVRGAAGVIEEVSPVARRRGTTVSVHRLFFNTPARRKFLRGTRSEWRAISDTVANMSLVRRDVHYVVRHDGRIALELPAVPNLKARLAALWGHDAVARFLDVTDVHGVVHVRGVIERPADVGNHARRTALIVNGRLVRDTGLTRAVEAAYRSTLPSGLRPSFVLELTVPGDAVDVNVHPAKAEIRLRERWAVERAVEQIIQRALGTFDATPAVGWRTWAPSGVSDGTAAPLEPWMLRAPHAPVDGLFASPTMNGGATTGDVAERDGSPVAADASTADVNSAERMGADHPSTSASVAVPPLLQLRRMYVMFEHADGVVLIDQHAAHERVLYERFLRALQRGDAPSQRLLLPLTVHLSAAESEAFDHHASALQQVGYEMEPFGGHSLLVHAVPTPHPRFDAERCLRDTLAALAGDRSPSDAARHERLLSTVACKAAVKAGDALGTEEMRQLYRDLANTTLPMHDVHGRAVMVRVSWDELDRRFGRA